MSPAVGACVRGQKRARARFFFVFVFVLNRVFELTKKRPKSKNAIKTKPQNRQKVGKPLRIGLVASTTVLGPSAMY
jgi:hypothetical protein